jgi:alginate biosynthesis protein Alg44
MSDISHEAEVQRQHTRYRIPMRCELRGTQYEVADWSIGGFGLASVSDELKAGRLEPVRISFPFGDYSLTMTMDTEVRYVDVAKGRAGFKFVNATRRQIDVLRFVIDAYLSGEVVDARDVIEVSARRNEAQARPVPAIEAPATLKGKVSQISGRVVRLGVAAAAGIVLTAFVGTSLYDRLLVVPARSAIVTTDLVTVPSPVGGSVAFLAQAETVKRGEPLAALETIDGKSNMVASPCDCLVQVRYAVMGDFVTAGMPMISLRRQDAKPYVAAFVPRDQIMRIYDGATARVVLTNGQQITDTQIRVVPANEQNASAPGSNELIKVVVDLPAGTDAARRIGEPAKVFFEAGLQKSLASLPVVSAVFRH